ncbi:cytochrome P450 [Streptomyces natalensis ATCC 27448]|uniref:Cytochrome P450 n=1 Tax=Streptomyces natalensis ATCC 27448 TaxID=1240678 RepID=A0A0D7CL82_9ACTN|nr:cytochrome P450 [Streptomyces natalensis ATCC 27448]
MPRYPFTRTPGCPFDLPAELQQLRRTESITRVSLWDGSNPWLLTRYEDVRSVLADRRFSSDRRQPGFPPSSAGQRIRNEVSPSFVGMDDPEHARHRRMLVGEFSARQTAGLRPMVAEIVDSLLDEMARQTGPVDLMESYAIPLPFMVVCRVLGVPYTDRAFIEEHLNVRLDARSSPDLARESISRMHDYVLELVRQRETEPTDDLLGRLVQRRVHTGELTRDQAASMAELLLAAGNETTFHMIGLGTLMLLRDPELAAVVRDGEPAQVSSAVEELLRLLSIAHAGRRRVALEDVTIGGVTIRAGEGVIAATNMADRDPDEFPQPDRLNLGRTRNRHLAFGFGPHQCLGASLARLELQLAYPALLRRFPALRLAVPEAELRFIDGKVIYGVEEVPVSW